MQTSVEEISKNKVRLTIEVPTADVEKVLSRTYKRLAGEIRVPGFRPGKAPRQVIDQRLGKDFVRNEALKDMVPDLYAAAVRSEEIEAVAPPEIDIKTFEDGQDLTFEAVVETRPEPELRAYEGLPGRKPKVDVTDEDVDSQIENLQTRFASLEVAERPIQEGDFAQIDLTTYRHDQTIDELTAKDLLIEVGAGMVVPELDAELAAKRKGDILKITATLPEHFGERGGWQVGMTVLVKETKVRKLPALDDEFAKTVSEFDTLEELRADIRGRLQEMAESQSANRLRESVLEAFAETAVDVDLPDGMVDMEVDGLISQMAQVLASQNVSLEQYMQMQGLEPAALRSQFREQAVRNLTMRLGLDALARKEGLTVTEEERSEEIELLAKRAGRTPADVLRSIEEGEAWKSVDGDILRSKALDLLVEKADVTVTEEEEPPTPGSSEPRSSEAGSSEEGSSEEETSDKESPE